MSREEIDTIVRKLVDSGVETLNLGGNEPIYTSGPNITKTLLPYLIKKVTENGIKIGITTNGITAVYLYNNHRDIFRLVNDWDVSLDSPFEEEHNANRGVPIYNLAMKALRLMSSEKVPKSIVYCLMNWNSTSKHLSALLDVAKREKSEIRVNTLRPIVKQHMDLFPSPFRFYSSFHYLITHTSSVIMSEPVIAALCGVKVEGCPCGITSMRIISKTAGGKVPVTPCVYLNSLAGGDVLTDDLGDLETSTSFALIRDRNKNYPSFCNEINCEYRDICRGGCAARALLVNGSFNEVDPYCPMIQMRKGVKIPEFPKVKLKRSGVRVHENYLCTWSGEPA